MKVEITDEYLYKIMPKVTELIMEDVPQNPEMPFEPSQEFEKKIKKLIRKSNRPKRLKFMNRKFSRVACFAIIVIAIGAVLSVSVLANQTLRMKIKERILLEDAVIEYFEVSGEGSIKHPTYIPDGYELVNEDPDFYRAEYQNPNKNRIIYEAWILEDGSMLFHDTEFVSETMYSINGNNIIFGYKENGTFKVSWYDDNVFYLIHIDSLPEAEVVAIIESIK